MAKKTTTTVTEDLEQTALGTTTEIPEILSPEMDEMLALEDMAASIGVGVGRVRVYRIERNGDTAFVGEYAAEELTEAKIQEDFGGGKYTVRFLNSQKQYVKQKTLIIAEPRRKDVNDQISTALTEIRTSSKGGGIDMAQLLQIQLAQSQRAEERSMQMITALIGALGGRGGNATNPADFVNAVVALKQATTPENGMFAGIKEILEITKTLTGVANGPAKEDNLYSVIRDVAPGIVETLAVRQNGNGNGNGNGHRPNPPQATVTELSPGSAQPLTLSLPAPVQAQPEPEAPMMRQIRLLREAVAFLKPHAQKGKDIDWVIDYIFGHDQGENEMFDVLLGAIDGYSFETLAGQDPDINGPLRAWFQEFYDKAKNELHSVNNSGGGGGNPANTLDNGPVSTASATPAPGPGDGT